MGMIRLAPPSLFYEHPSFFTTDSLESQRRSWKKLLRSPDEWDRNVQKEGGTAGKRSSSHSLTRLYTFKNKRQLKTKLIKHRLHLNTGVFLGLGLQEETSIPNVCAEKKIGAYLTIYFHVDCRDHFDEVLKHHGS